MKILIAVPCMSMLPVEYVNSLLKLEHEGQCDIVHLPNSLIYTARDQLAVMRHRQELLCFKQLVHQSNIAISVGAMHHQ